MRTHLPAIALLWALFPDPAWSQHSSNPLDPLRWGFEQSECSACFGAIVGAGEVPLFRSGQRDSTQVYFAAARELADGVGLRIFADRLWANWPDGTQQSGWGDIRLANSARLWASSSGDSVWMDWGIKLPNAADQSGLGSDESDAHVGLFGRKEVGSVRLGVSLSLGILGDPLQYANQDDVLTTRLRVGQRLGAFEWSSLVAWRWRSPRNPADGRVLLEGAYSAGDRGLFVGAGGGVGLNPAAPDWQAMFHLGWGVPCRTSQGD